MTSVLLVEVKIFALIFSVHHIDLSNSVVFKSEKMVCFLTDMLHCYTEQRVGDSKSLSQIKMKKKMV